MMASASPAPRLRLVRNEIYWSRETQPHDVCRTLLSLVGLGHLWGKTRPLREARDLWAESIWARKRLRLSPEREVMFRIAWDVYTGSGEAGIYEATASLPPVLLRAVGELLVAMAEGPEAVDGWLERYEGGRLPQEAMQ